VLGLGEAARYALAAGVEECGARATALAARLRDGLAALPGVRVLDRGSRLGAIVTATVTGDDGPALATALRARGINTSATYRCWAWLDMSDKHADSALRLSPHYFNTEEEIDQAIEVLAEVTRAVGVAR
jgi:selenocysteine lyase/cysteine desulfurase